MCTSDYMRTTFFYFGRLWDDQCSSITKDCIYHIKYNVHTAFNHGSGSISYAYYLHILHFYFEQQSNASNHQFYMLCNFHVHQVVGLLLFTADFHHLSQCTSSSVVIFVDCVLLLYCRCCLLLVIFGYPTLPVVPISWVILLTDSFPTLSWCTLLFSVCSSSHD